MAVDSVNEKFQEFQEKARAATAGFSVLKVAAEAGDENAKKTCDAFSRSLGLSVAKLCHECGGCECHGCAFVMGHVGAPVPDGFKNWCEVGGDYTAAVRELHTARHALEQAGIFCMRETTIKEMEKALEDARERFKNDRARFEEKQSRVEAAEKALEAATAALGFVDPEPETVEAEPEQE